MPKVTFQPDNHSVDVPDGYTIFDAATLLGLPIPADCGGGGTCGKCRVRFDDDVPPPNQTESDLVPAASLAAGYRLACQQEVRADLTIWLPSASRSRPTKGLAGQSDTPLELRPLVRRAPLTGLDQAELEGNLEAINPPSPTGQETVLYGREVIAVRPVAGRQLLGVAFDVGTTTIGGYLINLETGEQLANLAIGNPQGAHGADVITRIHYTNTHIDGLTRMQGLCVSALNELLEDMLDEAHASAQDVFYATVVGNPTMMHLMLGIDPGPIATPPFHPAFRDPQLVTARSIGLEAVPGAKVETLPMVSGYVGADSVGMAVSLRLDQRNEVCIAIDVGTNGELILSNRGQLFACSTAAGPAFEGARITWGMRAQPGAIDSMKYEAETGRFVLGAIDGSRPRGICGPGLLSVVATLLEAGVIDRTGRFVATNPNAAGRLRGTGARAEFVLVDAAETEHGQDVTLTQRDIRELQLAKSAMAAGTYRLLSHAGLRLEDVSHICLAGAFGSFLDPWAARRTGLLLPVPLERIVAVGNAAGAGARMVLCSQDIRQVAKDVAAKIEYLELSGDSDFNDLFMREMEFPASSFGE